MSFITDQLLDMDADKLVELHNKIASENSGRHIFTFNEKGLNEFFSTPWEVIEKKEMFEKEGIKKDDFFVQNDADSVSRISIHEIYSETLNIVDFETIDTVLNDNTSLAKEYNIILEDFEEYEINDFIGEWCHLLSFEDKKELVEKLLNASCRTGKIEDETVFVRPEY